MDSWRLNGLAFSLISICFLHGCGETDKKMSLENGFERCSEKWERVFRDSDPVEDISINPGDPIERYLRSPKVDVRQPVIPWPDRDDKLKLNDLDYQEEGPFSLEMISFHQETNIVSEVRTAYSLKAVAEEEYAVAFDSAVEHFNRIYQVCPDNPRQGEWITTCRGEVCCCRLRLEKDHANPRLIFSYSIDWHPSERTPEEFCERLDRLTPSFLSCDVRELIRPDLVDFCVGRQRLGKRVLSESAMPIDIKEPGLGLVVDVDKELHKIVDVWLSQQIQGPHTRTDALNRFAQFSDYFSQHYQVMDSLQPPCDLTRFEAFRVWVRHSADRDNLIVLGLHHGSVAWSIEALVFN